MDPREIAKILIQGTLLSLLLSLFVWGLEDWVLTLAERIVLHVCILWPLSIGITYQSAKRENEK
jgi:uncharacterized protein YqhQ